MMRSRDSKKIGIIYLKVLLWYLPGENDKKS
jgi:hypothetical protein